MSGITLGLDIGTSGAKAAVFDGTGAMLACSHAGYVLQSPTKGAMELDPNEVLAAVHKCLAGCAAQCDVKRVEALAVSTQGEAIIPIDAAGNPLANAVLSFDSRCAAEFAELSRLTDRAQLADITGMPSSPMFSATKIAWLKRAKPEVYKKAWKLCCFGDFISLRLGAAPAMDESMAARTMLFDLKRRAWSGGLLALLEIPREKLPAVVPSGTVIGRAGPELLAHGFSPECKLVAGAHDQLCCTLGAGVCSPGDAMDSMGTTESIVCVDNTLASPRSLLPGGIPVYPYPGGLYAYMTFLSTCASLTKWFQEKLVDDVRPEFFGEYDAYIKAHYPGPTELYVLPYFAGSGTPALDYAARGAVVGLTLDTDRYQLYRAVLESTCFEVKKNLANMDAAGIRVDTLRCIGGGARSELWLQMKADITGKRVVSMECPEAGCLGAALLAGIGGGLLETVQGACAAFTREKWEFLPNPVVTEQYEPHWKTYETLYPAVKPLWRGAAV